jgi:beta-galactosidase
LQVNDGKKTVYETEKEVSMIPHTDVQVENIEFILKNPRLWNGMQDPFMYQAVLTLIKDGKELDKVEQPLGLRYYVTDPDKGFFLNGKHLPLHGVCRHQERAEVGNALCPVHTSTPVNSTIHSPTTCVILARSKSQVSYLFSRIVEITPVLSTS